MGKSDLSVLWFIISSGIIAFALLSPLFMTLWDVSAAAQHAAMFGVSFEEYLWGPGQYDDYGTKQGVLHELPIFVPLVVIGVLLLIANILLLKYRKGLLKFTFIYAVPYFLVSAPVIFWILT